MSIADKLDELTTIRGDIRSALTAKGVSASDHDFADFAQDIANISTLPSGFQKVDYIQSSGTQWINTGITGRNGIKVVQDFEYTDTNGVQNHGSVYYLHNFIWGVADGKFRVIFGTMGDWSDFGTADTNRHTWTLDLPQNKCLLDETEINISPGTFTTSYNLYLFNCSASGTPDRGCKGKLYGCQIYADGSLVRDYVPCYRKSDNVIGLWDAVNGQFYTNAGSGSFACYPSPT